MKKIMRTSLHIIPFVFMICCLVPFLMVLAVSFSDEATVKNFGYSLIPKVFSTEAYRYTFAYPMQLLRAYTMSIAVVLIGTPLSLILTSGIAYPLSRRDFKYRRFLSIYLFITMIFSGGLVPSYILISRYLQLKDTLAVLIVPTLVSAWNIILLRTFMQTIPVSLIESAKLDGASELSILFKIIIPLSKTGLATIALFVVLAYWNDWYTSMLYIDDPNLTTLQYLLYKLMNNVTFMTQQNSGVARSMMGSMTLPDETVRMAICVLAAGPMLIVFPLFQKYFVKGITIGSVKG